MIIDKNKRKRITLTALAVVLPSGLGACNQQPPAEKPEQNIGRAAESAKQKIDLAKAAVAEKAAASGDAVENAALTARVKAALIAEPSIKGLAIDVDSKDGIVTLFGTVDNLANRDKVTHVASGVEGVRSVLNNVKIISGS
ncbi:MAG: BON domain-containing protein [Pseudomonadota bacterium]